jgi:hypothetical protein
MVENLLECDLAPIPNSKFTEQPADRIVLAGIRDDAAY